MQPLDNSPIVYTIKTFTIREIQRQSTIQVAILRDVGRALDTCTSNQTWHTEIRVAVIADPDNGGRRSGKRTLGAVLRNLPPGTRWKHERTKSSDISESSFPSPTASTVSINDDISARKYFKPKNFFSTIYIIAIGSQELRGNSTRQSCWRELWLWGLLLLIASQVFR
jgi:hypothetical protein